MDLCSNSTWWLAFKLSEYCVLCPTYLMLAVIHSTVVCQLQSRWRWLGVKWLTKDTVWILSQSESRSESFFRSEQKNQSATLILKCAPLALMSPIAPSDWLHGQVVARQHWKPLSSLLSWKSLLYKVTVAGKLHFIIWWYESTINLWFRYLMSGVGCDGRCG